MATPTPSQLEERLVVLLQTAACEPDRTIRTQAETELEVFSRIEGFGVLLLKVASVPSCPEHLRMIALICLRQHVTKHWVKDVDDDTPSPFVITDNEKSGIKSNIAALLSDPSPNIRSHVSTVIASAARHEYPEKWAELVPALLHALRQRQDLHLTHGASLTLQYIVSVNSRCIPALLPALLGDLLSTFGDHSLGDSTRCNAGECLYVCLHWLSLSDSKRSPQLTEMLTQCVDAWVKHALQHLTLPPTADASCGLRLVVLKTMAVLVAYFPKMVQPHLGQMFTSIWTCFAKALTLYEPIFVVGHHANTPSDLSPSDCRDHYNDNGDDVGLESFVCAVLSVLQSVVESPLRAGLQQALQETCLMCIGYMQVTVDQEDQFEDNPTEFVAEEEDEMLTSGGAGNVRSTATYLFQAVTDMYGDDGVRACLAAVQQRLQDVQKARESGIATWWKLREAVVLAIGSVSDSVEGSALEAAHTGGGSGVTCDVGDILMFLLEDITGGRQDLPANPSAVLKGAALWCSSHFVHSAPPDLSLQFCNAAVQCMCDPSLGYAVKISACRAVSSFAVATTHKSTPISDHAGALLASLCDMIAPSSADTMHIVLETLALVVKANPVVTAQLLEPLTQALLYAWKTHWNDPLLTQCVRDVFKELVAILPDDACVSALFALLLPVIGGIVGDESSHSSLVEAAMDLLEVLLRSRKGLAMQHVESAFASLLSPMVTVLLHSTDHSILQSGSDALGVLVSKLPDTVVQNNQVTVSIAVLGGADGVRQEVTVPVWQCLVMVVTRILDPSLADSAALGVGQLVTRLILKAHTVLGKDGLSSLFEVLLLRLSSAKLRSVVQELVMTIAQLVMVSTNTVIDILTLSSEKRFPLHFPREYQSHASDALQQQQQQQRDQVMVSASELITNHWVWTVPSIYGKRNKKLVSMALVQLLMSNDVRITSLLVHRKRGKEYVSTNFVQEAFRVLVECYLLLQAEELKPKQSFAERMNAFGFGSGALGFDGPDGDEDFGDEFGEDDDDLYDVGHAAQFAGMLGGRGQTASSSPFAPAEDFEGLLDEMLDGGGEDDDAEDVFGGPGGADEDDELYNIPSMAMLKGAELEDLLKDVFFVPLSTTHAPVFQQLLATLTDEQRAVLVATLA